MENNPVIVQYPEVKQGQTKIVSFLNATGIPNNEAMKIHDRLERIIDKGNSLREKRIANEEANLELYRGSIWTATDLEEFAKLDVYPYEFKDHRAVIGNMLSRQRENRFRFKIVPNDVNSYRRHVAGLEEFLQNHEHEFPDRKAAEDYYNEIADDKYAAALSAYMSNVRYYSNGEYEESDLFENGIVIGAHAIKAVYSDDVIRDNGIRIINIPIRAMIYDELSIRYDRDDIEYIGETYELNLSEILKLFPDFREQLLKLYKDKTASENQTTRINDDYTTRFKFGEESVDDHKIKIHDLFVRTSTMNWRVQDTVNNTTHIVKDPLMSREEVIDRLKGILTKEKLANDPSLGFVTEDLSTALDQEVTSRFSIEQVPQETWYQAILTSDAFLYWGPSRYPHGSHPYAFYYPQFTQGKYNSPNEEIADIVKALNKAYMFQEMMMAGSAKGLIVVNEDVMIQSNYDITQITEAYTRIGGVLVAKLKPMQKLDQFVQQLTTVGQGLGEMSRIIALYENKLRNIAGITMAQMGVTQGETPTGRYKLELAQGQQNNGIIYDNFIRTLHTFYRDKVMPLCVHEMKTRKVTTIRLLGEQHSQWINVDYDQDYDLFTSSVSRGLVGFFLVPEENDPQMKNVRAAQLQQFAMATGDPTMFAWALKFSDDPNRHEIVRELYKAQRQNLVAQIENQIDIQMVQQIALEQGISADLAEKIVSKLKIERMKQLQQERMSAGAGKQMVQGDAQIQRAATSPTRMAQIEQ